MRVVVIGGTGNIGTALVRALRADPGVDEVVAVSRRPPLSGSPAAEATWRRADVAEDDLAPIVAGADAVVHLAWAIQPSHDGRRLWRTNVLGSRRVFQAAVAGGARAIVHASSIGAYSRGPKDRHVDEGWPRDGIATSFYARHKADAERRLDLLEQEHPDVRVVRMRPAFVFTRESAVRVTRLFAGPLVPRQALRLSKLPVIPDVPGVAFQVVHTEDVAEAFRLALHADVRGAFNLASEPPLDMPAVARILGARPLPVPPAIARALIGASWHARLQPSPPSWLDLALGVPLMDSTRARTELGWAPRVGAEAALLEVLDAARGGAPEGAAPAHRAPVREDSPGAA
jgi:UDP-glucose 4-epimerase